MRRDQDIWSIWWRGQGEKDCYRCGEKGHLARQCGAYGRRMQERAREQGRQPTWAEMARGRVEDTVETSIETVVEKPTEEQVVQTTEESEAMATEVTAQAAVEETLLEGLANVALVPRSGSSSVRVEADAVVQVQSDVPGTANPTLEEQEREKQVEEQQEQEEVEMEVEALQGKGGGEGWCGPATLGGSEGEPCY